MVNENDREAKLKRLRALLRETGGIAVAFKDLGFAYVTLDLQGYRTGSLNETLERNGSWASA